jgi:hypothetical protein
MSTEITVVNRQKECGVCVCVCVECVETKEGGFFFIFSDFQQITSKKL